MAAYQFIQEILPEDGEAADIIFPQKAYVSLLLDLLIQIHLDPFQDSRQFFYIHRL